MPEVIEFTFGSSAYRSYIKFVYDASGVKLRKIVQSYNNATLTSEKIFDYVNGVEYEGNTLQRLSHTEGSISRQDDGTFAHEFVLRDHLGNTRVTFSDLNNDGIVTSADIKQINHYYPFGLNMEGNWNGAVGKNKYQYNSKELNSDFGLEWNDYGARFYDPAGGRWLSPDPLAEKYMNHSPYNYVKNSPTLLVDPNGMEVVNSDDRITLTGEDAVNFFNDVRQANGGGKKDSEEQNTQGQQQELQEHGNEATTTNSSTSGGANNKTAESGGCGGAGQPPCPPDKTGNFGEDFMNSFKYAFSAWGWVGATTADNIDTEYGSPGKNALNGDYTQAAMMLVMSRVGGSKMTGWVKRKEFQKLESLVQEQVKRAIAKGIVGPKGKLGIVIVDKTEDLYKAGYRFKIKIDADLRIYGKEIEDTGHIFFDYITGHKK